MKEDGIFITEDRLKALDGYSSCWVSILDDSESLECERNFAFHLLLSLESAYELLGITGDTYDDICRATENHVREGESYDS